MKIMITMEEEVQDKEIVLRENIRNVNDTLAAAYNIEL